jgi:hypothetical protein
VSPARAKVKSDDPLHPLALNTPRFGPAVTPNPGRNPAFPTYPTHTPGMTMRMYYKAAALQGILTEDMRDAFRAESNSPATRYLAKLAAACGHIADAMLAEDEEHAKK